MTDDWCQVRLRTTADDEPGWAAITLEFIGGSDDKTAGGILAKLEGYHLRLRTDQGVREIKMIDPYALDGHIGGIEFEPVDNNGTPIGPPEFLDYAQVRALGIY